MKHKIILIAALLAPAFIINYWHGDPDKLSLALALFVTLLVTFIVCFVVGIMRKSKYLLLSLPAFVAGIIGMFVIINWQSARNDRNADILINSLTDFKAKNGNYPKDLSELTPTYIGKVPKIWFGVFFSDFEYSSDKQSFSLKLQAQNDTYKVWESSIGQWQFFD